MSEFPLPNELIECILDNLYHDKATLLNCALVGKAWVPRSQKGLFQRIVIEAPNSHHEDYVTLATAFLAAYERLLAIYDAKPHLATYARTLELRQYEKPSRTVDAKELQETLQTCTAKVIQRLTNITNLSILRLNWSQINPPMRAALTGVFQIPSVVRVSLSLFAIPTFAELASLLSHVTHLKVLKITFLACHNWDIPLPPSPADDSNPDVRSISTSPPPPRSIHLDELVHLHLVNIRAFTAWFQKDWCPFQVSNLHSLHLHRSATFDYHGTAFMLESIGENLKELELQGPYQSQHLNLNVVHLGYTPNLESVRLISVQQTDSYSPVPWIRSLFEPLLNTDRKKTSLKRLTIDLNIDHIDPMKTHQWDMWMAIDSLFVEPEFLALENVNINLMTTLGSVPDGLLWLLGQKLMFLENRRKLRVRIPVTAEVNFSNIKAVTLF